MSWHHPQFLLQSSGMPNNRDFLANRASNVHPEAAQLRIQLEDCVKQEKEKVSHPLQTHSVTKYLLSSYMP